MGLYFIILSLIFGNEIRTNKVRRFIKYFSERGLIISFFGVLLYFSFIGINGEFKNYILNYYSESEKGVIINKKNYKGNNTRLFSYSYKFMVKEKSYLGDSRDIKYEVGDSVLIEFWPRFPDFNRLKE